MSAWERYFETIANTVVDPGLPVFARSVLGEVGATTQLGGYSVITAKSLDEAEALARSCPTLTCGGGVEVGELSDLPADHPASRLRLRARLPDV
jgi:hypothetical protein